MKKYDASFSDDELGAAFGSYEGSADEYLGNETKMQQLFSQIKALVYKLTRVPVIGKYVDDILDIIQMISDYKNGIYTAVPKKSIVMLTALLIYLASPIDLIPDAIPVIGWLDDAAMIAFVYRMGIKKDLDTYREWKEINIISDGEIIDCGE